MKSVVRTVSGSGVGMIWICLPLAAGAQMPFYGDYYLHDPGTMIKDGSNYFIFGDGQGISGITSTDLRNWAATSAGDSIGMAHGTLMGDAAVTNGALVLDGTAGGCVNPSGGLVSGSSAVTLECWATFSANGNWTRVADFGNISGGSGIQYFFYSPHTSLAGSAWK